MQLFNAKCKKPHWFVVEGKLMLETTEEKHQDLAKQVIKVLEQEIRQKIYDEICDWQPLSNRAQIMKISGSIDNALLGVQAICADIALGNKNGSN